MLLFPDTLRGDAGRRRHEPLGTARAAPSNLASSQAFIRG
jgi:hypothetical protein